MEAIDLEVLSVLFFQQWLEATEHSQWDEAVMALYKLQAIQQKSSDMQLHHKENQSRRNKGDRIALKIQAPPEQEIHLMVPTIVNKAYARSAHRINVIRLLHNATLLA